MTHEQEDNELTYPIGYLDMQREAAISKAHELLDALIDSNARRDLIDMQFAKLRGKVDSERSSLRAQLENACASQADTDAVAKLQSENAELWNLIDEAKSLIGLLRGALLDLHGIPIYAKEIKQAVGMINKIADLRAQQNGGSK